MGKKGGNAISKGVFHNGFNKGKDGPGGPAERSMQTVQASGKPLSKEARMKYEASKGLTKEGMRKPFGG